MKTHWHSFIGGLLFAGLLAGCASAPEIPPAPDYSTPAAWAWWNEGGPHAADIFVIAPSVYGGSAEHPNMALDDEKHIRYFIGALNMQRGIFEASCTRYAPFYRQAGLNAYPADGDTAHPVFQKAYTDIRAAFQTFLAQTGNRPFVLFGFSQGADMGLRLLKEFGAAPGVANRLAAAYLIGWRVTPADLAAAPHLKMAQGETDTGVIITFNSEAPGITGSMMIPAGTSTYSINPLNWTTNETPAPKELNLGACFTDYDAAITQEIPMLTGAQLDPVRGALKITDITPEEYPPVIWIFPPGIYHFYDYQFFFRNLQDNLPKRLAAIPPAP